MQHSAALAALEVWSQSAPEDALDWAEAREAEAQRNEYAAKVLDSVKRLSPQRAIEVALRARNPHVRADGILYALLKWCPGDPVAAVQAFLALPEKDRDENTLRQITASVASSSLGQARELLAQIPEGPQRLLAQAAVVLVRRDADPATVADLALSLAEKPENRSLVAGVIRRWHQQDPAAVERWIAELPDSAGKKVAAETIAAVKGAGGNER